MTLRPLQSLSVFLFFIVAVPGFAQTFDHTSGAAEGAKASERPDRSPRGHGGFGRERSPHEAGESHGGKDSKSDHGSRSDTGPRADNGPKFDGPRGDRGFQREAKEARDFSSRERKDHDADKGGKRDFTGSIDGKDRDGGRQAFERRDSNKDSGKEFERFSRDLRDDHDRRGRNEGRDHLSSRTHDRRDNRRDHDAFDRHRLDNDWRDGDRRRHGRDRYEFFRDHQKTRNSINDRSDPEERLSLSSAKATKIAYLQKRIEQNEEEIAAAYKLLRSTRDAKMRAYLQYAIATRVTQNSELQARIENLGV